MFIKHNILAFFWALFILFLCGIPGKDLPDLTYWDNLSLDKVFHLILFAILVVFTISGFKKQTNFAFLEKYAKINALTIVTFYGGLTELLQGTLFVDRKASIFDFLANFIGSLLGMLLYNHIVKLVSVLINRRKDRFDEILFENRFKDYGAYKLRNSYNKHMSFAIWITVTIFLAFFFIILMKGFVDENKNNMEDTVVISEFMESPPLEANTQPPPPVPPSSSTQLGNLVDKIKFSSPVIVQDSVDYVDSIKHTNVNPLADNDSINGTNNNNNSLSGNGADVYAVVDEFPKFPGGDEARIKFLQANVKYPKVASYNGIKGVVYINFIIEKDGSMSNIKLLMGIGGGCDEEALRVARLMPKWTPGKRKGQAVRVYINMPIKFFSPTS